MTTTNFTGSAAPLREALKRQLPDDPNYVRIRETGGTENRVGEQTGATEQTTDFRAVRAPEATGQQWRGGSTSVEGDLTLFILDDLLEEGDRVERLSDATAYRVTDVTDVDWQGEQIGFDVTLERQHD